MSFHSSLIIKVSLTISTSIQLAYICCPECGCKAGENRWDAEFLLNHFSLYVRLLYLRL